MILQVEYSAKMEPFAAKLLLGRLIRKKIGVRVLTTDRSSSLKKLLRDVNAHLRTRKLMPIKHSFDIWHIGKLQPKKKPPDPHFFGPLCDFFCLLNFNK
jgi:transposase-like protein